MTVAVGSNSTIQFMVASAPLKMQLLVSVTDRGSGTTISNLYANHHYITFCDSLCIITVLTPEEDTFSLSRAELTVQA